MTPTITGTSSPSLMIKSMCGSLRITDELLSAKSLKVTIMFVVVEVVLEIKRDTCNHKIYVSKSTENSPWCSNSSGRCWCSCRYGHVSYFFDVLETFGHDFRSKVKAFVTIGQHLKTRWAMTRCFQAAFKMVKIDIEITSSQHQIMFFSLTFLKQAQMWTFKLGAWWHFDRFKESVNNVNTHVLILGFLHKNLVIFSCKHW